jgi:hypothetical protein
MFEPSSVCEGNREGLQNSNLLLEILRLNFDGRKITGESAMRKVALLICNMQGGNPCSRRLERGATPRC